VTNSPKPRPRPTSLAADPSAQDRPAASYAPLDKYEDTKVPCAGCGRPVLWTAQMKQYWFEEVRAPVNAAVSLRCTTCRERGRHAGHREAQRAKAKWRRRDEA
jgi:hypothetical protein